MVGTLLNDNVQNIIHLINEFKIQITSNYYREALKGSSGSLEVKLKSSTLLFTLPWSASIGACHVCGRVIGAVEHDGRGDVETVSQTTPSNHRLPVCFFSTPKVSEDWMKPIIQHGQHGLLSPT